MSLSTDRPWVTTLSSEPKYIQPLEPTTVPELLAAAVATAPEAPAVKYYGWEATWAQIDEQAGALAAYLAERGFGPGDVLGIYLQNVPHYYVAALATWKLGGVVVPLNPMYRDELAHVFADASVKALVVSAAAYNDRVKDYAADLDIVITCNDRDLVQVEAERIFGAFPAQIPTGRPDLSDIVKEYSGRSVQQAPVTRESPAIYGYTSGTSGKSKGAVLTHGNLTVNAIMSRDMMDYGPGNVMFTLAPVFHITGFVCQFLANIACRSALSMNYRFDPVTSLEIFRRDRPNYMAGPATAFMALLAVPGFEAADFESFDQIMSGGAPLPEAIVAKFEERTGYYISQGYGLTETSAQCALVPNGFRAPVDEESGNLSCGLPLASVTVSILDDEGHELAAGEVGEVCVSGPMVTHEYLGNPEATARDIPGGLLHTGDVGYLDAEGWLFIVDRKKDMINASGFKVWPREVEDALYLMPQVLEAAVVGVPDEYRGENVVAYVTRQPGSELSEADVIAHARKHLAAFKAPHRVVIIDEMPKTASGKVLRRELRATARETAEAARTAAGAED
ncbi:AMP-binding protein [Brevibacterium sp. 50QC2O2]|uniref:class I adenylate-forming enzyme family protein n=1 Tax=Brevibacterium TaxID=1696 RepID=UPI00211CF1A6|nr:MULTISPECIES: AMP-binding protein [unclassified Brevibacterium]MCQ9384210.1 AMP-binding protein [Brevibacterium sp. 68QC2CO]MCQ9388311.1 AMP-binding protein [Brevibacterium sp. 50QC2O2]